MSPLCLIISQNQKPHKRYGDKSGDKSQICHRKPIAATYSSHIARLRCYPQLPSVTRSYPPVKLLKVLMQVPELCDERYLSDKICADDYEARSGVQLTGVCEDNDYGRKYNA